LECRAHCGVVVLIGKGPGGQMFRKVMTAVVT
jgi:hypothetical protein